MTYPTRNQTHAASRKALPTARRFLTAALALTLPLWALSACGSDSQGAGSSSGSAGGTSKGTIAFSFQYSEIPMAGPIKDFAAAKAQEMGYDFVTDNIQGGKVDEQIASIDSFIAQGVDAIVVHQQDPSLYTSIIQRAHDAGIKYVGYFEPAEGEDGFVAFDQSGSAEKLSADAAQWINDNLDGKGKVLLLVLTTDEVSRKVTDLLSATILAETDSQIVATQDALDQATGLQITEDTLTAHPDVNVVLTWNDGGALGAAAAFENLGIDPAGVYVASNQAGEDSLQAMKDGNEYLKAISVLSVRTLGEGVAQVPINLLDGTGESELFVPQVIVHPQDTDKIDELLSEYK